MTYPTMSFVVEGVAPERILDTTSTIDLITGFEAYSCWISRGGFHGTG
jgi:hypothetical protein